jgi:hypothetical protein
MSAIFRAVVARMMARAACFVIIFYENDLRWNPGLEREGGI